MPAWTWLAVGANYQYSPALAFDVGYAHLFGGNGSINNTRTVLLGTSTTVTGDYDNAIDIFSVQVTMVF